MSLSDTMNDIANPSKMEFETQSKDQQTCEICTSKDNEDLNLIFNVIYKSMFGDSLFEMNKDDVDDPKSQDLNISYQKISKFKSHLSKSLLLDTLSSTYFQRILSEIFKAKYISSNFEKCSHHQLQETLLKIFNLEKAEPKSHDLHNENKSSLLNNLNKVLDFIKDLKLDIESTKEEISEMPDHITRRLFQQNSEKGMHGKKLNSTLKTKSGSSICKNSVTDSIMDNMMDGPLDSGMEQQERKTKTESLADGTTVHNSDNNGSGSSNHNGSSTTNFNGNGNTSESSESNSNYQKTHDKNSANKSKLPKKATDILKTWFLNNINNPYPSVETKELLCKMTGLSKKQIQNWFTNSRKRFLEPLKKKIEKTAGGYSKLSHQNMMQFESAKLLSKSDVNVAQLENLPEITTITTEKPVEATAESLHDTEIKTPTENLKLSEANQTVYPQSAIVFAQPEGPKSFTPFPGKNLNNPVYTIPTTTPASQTTPVSNINGISSYNAVNPIIYPSVYQSNNGYMVVSNPLVVQPSVVQPSMMQTSMLQSPYVVGYRQMPQMPGYLPVSYIPVPANNIPMIDQSSLLGNTYVNPMNQMQQMQQIHQMQQMQQMQQLQQNVVDMRGIMGQNLSTNYNTINNNVYNNINNLGTIESGMKYNGAIENNMRYTNSLRDALSRLKTESPQIQQQLLDLKPNLQPQSSQLLDNIKEGKAPSTVPDKRSGLYHPKPNLDDKLYGNTPTKFIHREDSVKSDEKKL